MKKILTGIFATLAVLALAGCGGNKTSESSSNDSANNSVNSESPVTSDSSVEIDDDLQTAAEYLESAYKGRNAETRLDYDVDAMMMGYPITWTVDVESGVTVGEVFEKDGKQYVTIDVNENLDADLVYVLTATLTSPSGQTVSVSFTRKVLAAPSIVPEAITEAPVEGVAYKYHVYQSTLATDMYFAGSMNGYYFKTTTDTAEAVDVFVEYVEGSTTEFYPYFNDATGAKMYLGVRLSDDSAHDNIVYDASPVTKFVWNTDLQTITTHLDVNKNGQAADYYFGNYSTHQTISASMLSYAGGAGNNVGHLVKLVDRNSITAEDKVAFEKEALNIELEYKGNVSVELPTLGIRFADVTVAWTIAENEFASISGNVLTSTAPKADTEVVITATITCGDIVETKEFTVTLKPAVVLPAYDTEISITLANQIGEAQASNELTEGKWYVKGVVTEIKNTVYGNLYIQDAAGNSIYVYGCYDADGTNKYEAMANPPQVGDTVKLYSAITSYNGAAQLKDAWVVEWTAAGDTPVAPPASEANITLTVDNLGISGTNDNPYAYITEELIVDVDGISYGLLSVGCYGNGIQCRTKNGLSATIRNTTALPGNITKIVMTPNADKAVYDGNAWKAYFGTTADCTELTLDVATAAGVITIDVTGEYSFFKLVHANTYSQYFDSIEIYYEEAEAAPTYTLTLMNGNPRMGGTMETFEYTEGAALELPTLEATGKIFKGWFGTDENGELTIAAPATMPAEAVALFALWEVEAYTLTIVNGENSTEFKFGVEYDFANGIEISVTDLSYVLADNLPENTEDYTYAWAESVPATFELKDYTFTVKATELLNTPEKILKAAYALAKDTALAGTYTLTGTIKSVDEAYNSQYQNVTVTIVVDGFAEMPMKCYRMKGDGADTLCVADVITVTGTIKNYGGTVEFDTGCTFVLVSKHECTEYSAATCTVPAKCTVCGNAKDDVLAAHNYVEGICDACGASEANENVEKITAYKTIAELIVSEGWDGTTTKQQFNLDDNVSVKVNGGSNTGKAYNGDHIRVYATDSPAGTLTISVAEGYELVSVKVSTQTGTYAFLCVDGSTNDISNIETAVSGSSVLLTSVKNGSNGKQVRVTAIEVVYKAVS